MIEIDGSLRLQGGTHNPHAPPFDFLQHAFLPLLERIGVRIEASLERYGKVERRKEGLWRVAVQPA